ncbi:MAG: homoserine kinase [Candidatus Dormiibacterota bacterium]
MSAVTGKPGVRVTVPASSANLGPGFDVLALALELVNTYDVWEIPTELRIEVEGEGAGLIPRDQDNLFYSAMNSYFAIAGYEPSGLHIRTQNRIPLGRGMGSSAATIIAGLVAARALTGYDVDDDRLLNIAGALEGHPDNVAAALGGGLVLVLPEDGEQYTVRRLPWPLHVGTVLFIPELLVSTDSAREVLPDAYPRADVVHNLSRVALFVAALQEGRADDLRLATQDRLHQPYRRDLVPGLDDIIAGALEAGALGAFLSGAGPTVMALFDRGGDDAGARIGEAMAAAARRFGLEGRNLVVEINPGGAEASALPPEAGS